MLLFLDTEFTSLTQQAELLSLAIVDENERIFYAEFTDYQSDNISDWIKENVISQFFLTSERSVTTTPTFIKGNTELVKYELVKWLEMYKNTTCKFVADVYMYDWVLFAELFGGALQLPPFIDFMPIDFSTLLFAKNEDSHKPRLEFLTTKEIENFNSKYPQIKAHSALYDTLLLKKCYEKLM